MAAAAKSRGSINLALVLVAALLAGFVGGFLFGQRGPVPAVTTQAVTQGCPHDLDPADRYIIAGFQCPNPGDLIALQDCHCNLAHQIKDWIKDELSKGKDGREIRQSLQTRYGDKLKPLSER